MLELLHLGGYSLPHAVLMMIPEAWENHESMPDWKRDFYQFHASLMEPWDGPASIAFTDGTVIGAVLDRNGLRPSRYWVTDDGLVVMASEVGVLPIDQSTVVQKGRLQPGRMFLIDTNLGRIVGDDEIKEALAAQQPYGEWLHAGLVHLDDLPARDFLTPQHASVVKHQRVFGYTTEELKVLLAPMARTGAEPIGSMGTDTPVAVLSDRSRLLFDYFQQLFAQVTNPPLDAIREELVTSMGSTIGPEGNLLAPARRRAGRWCSRNPILTNDELAKLLYINDDNDMPGFKPFAIDGLFRVAEGGDGLRRALEDVRAKVSAAIADGAKVIILSDRYSNDELAPIPSLLLTAAVHHHLIREKARTQVGLVIECGDAREVHHMALLLGYGAGAINPYLAFETIEDMIDQGVITGLTKRQAVRNFVKASTKGVLKIMSKMGISTVASLHRRPGVRGDRPRRRSWSTSTSPAPPAASAASGSTCSPRRWRPATGSPTSTVPRRPRTATCGPAASTSGAARASTTCSTPRPCSSCSTPRARSATTSSRSTRPASTTRPGSSPRSAACSGSRTASAPPGADRRGRAGRARSSSASPPAR